MAHSSYPRGVGVPSLETHLAHHVLSPSPSRVANALQFLFPVKGTPPPSREGCYSESQWESSFSE